jgi:hypothetical protein
MSFHKLSDVEAFRASVLLEESLKKLHFLTSIQGSNSVHGDELTQHMGDEISRIIQEQRDLEKKYEELISERGKLKGLCNKQKFIETMTHITEVAHKLKDSNKNLCRSLKENPNVQGNVLKMQAERAMVQEWFEETRADLIEHSYSNLVAKVDAEKRAQERLSEVKKLERDASQQVKQLEAELAREHAEHEKEEKQASLEIKELKEDLQKHKTISDIEFKFEEKKLRAREQALLRLHAQEEKALHEELKALEAAEETEVTVHERAHVFLGEKLESLQNQKDVWTNDYVIREVQEREAELNALKDKHADNATQLQDLEEKRRTEFDKHKEKEQEMRNAVLIDKQRREQLRRMTEAVQLLQEEGRKYMERIQARNAEKKKKGKKGKKK